PRYQRAARQRPRQRAVPARRAHAPAQPAWNDHLRDARSARLLLAAASWVPGTRNEAPGRSDQVDRPRPGPGGVRHRDEAHADALRATALSQHWPGRLMDCVTAWSSQSEANSPEVY